MINANAISSDLSGDDLIKKFRAWLDILDLRFDKIKVTCLGHQKTYWIELGWLFENRNWDIKLWSLDKAPSDLNMP